MGVFDRGSARRGTPSDALVIGLGNPGDEYARSCHNVGAEAVEVLADRMGIRLKAGKELSLTGEGRLARARVAIAFPLTYMNESGQAASKLVKRYGIDDASKVIVIHDELDLEPGRVKLKFGGGLAGNNGLKSIKAHLGTADFVRIRIGVGKPPHPNAGRDWVLRRVGPSERATLDLAVQVAADAAELVLSAGIEAAMNEVNRSPDV